MKNVRWRPLKSDQQRGDVGRRGHIWPIPLLRPVSLAQWYQAGSLIWSDPRKRSETLVSMNGTPCPPLPSPPSSLSPTSGGVLVGLAVLCLSGLIGLTCSLYTILSSQERQTSALTLHSDVSLCMYVLVLLSAFTGCRHVVVGVSQSLSLHFAITKKMSWISPSLINIDRRLPWRQTERDVRSVISSTGQGFSSYQWWWIIQPLPSLPPLAC